jgi:quinolinate synthase
VTAFPSLTIDRQNLTPRGAFAEAQRAFLEPDLQTVAELDGLLRQNNVGVVAHFYMDPELQGVLAACTWPHIHISDSLVMADRALQMAQAGVQAICVAGVDFMTENVRAVLDHGGFGQVPVYRLAIPEIGCSLAASAEAPAYHAFLQQAAKQPRSLHVVYINTSLRTKAAANALVPTITCTSSNVVQTILQAAAQIPDVHIWFGPDTYMGHNLQTLLQAYARMPEAAVRALHPAHTPATLTALLQRFHPFLQGNCIVHHLFGQEVVARVRRELPNALYAAHLEVPGEMFALAAAAERHGRGVVGSTSNILDFIGKQVDAAVQQPGPQRVEVVLGTEAGMITSIVRGVQARLQHAHRDDVAVEIIFPVAAQAVTQTDDALAIVPGGAGEGCSVEGGCATCPYMRMNHLDGLIDVIHKIAKHSADLALFLPKFADADASGLSVAARGTVPILYMRAFQRTGQLPEALVHAVHPA